MLKTALIPLSIFLATSPALASDSTEDCEGTSWKREAGDFPAQLEPTKKHKTSREHHVDIYNSLNAMTQSTLAEGIHVFGENILKARNFGQQVFNQKSLDLDSLVTKAGHSLSLQALYDSSFKLYLVERLKKLRTIFIHLNSESSSVEEQCVIQSMMVMIEYKLFRSGCHESIDRNVLLRLAQRNGVALTTHQVEERVSRILLKAAHTIAHMCEAFGNNLTPKEEEAYKNLIAAINKAPQAGL